MVQAGVHRDEHLRYPGSLCNVSNNLLEFAEVDFKKEFDAQEVQEEAIVCDCNDIERDFVGVFGVNEWEVIKSSDVDEFIEKNLKNMSCPFVES